MHPLLLWSENSLDGIFEIVYFIGGLTILGIMLLGWRIFISKAPTESGRVSRFFLLLVASPVIAVFLWLMLLMGLR